MDRKNRRHDTATESQASGIRETWRAVRAVYPEDSARRVVDLRAYCGDLQRRREPGKQSGCDMPLVPSLKERAGRIREIQGVSREETSQRLEEEIELWMRAFLAMEEKDKWESRAKAIGFSAHLRMRSPNSRRRHFGFSGEH